jgi:succinyl-CoA synthetase beta subunit
MSSTTHVLPASALGGGDVEAVARRDSRTFHLRIEVSRGLATVQGTERATYGYLRHLGVPDASEVFDPASV